MIVSRFFFGFSSTSHANKKTQPLTHVRTTTSASHELGLLTFCSSTFALPLCKRKQPPLEPSIEKRRRVPTKPQSKSSLDNQKSSTDIHPPTHTQRERRRRRRRMIGMSNFVVQFLLVYSFIATMMAQSPSASVWAATTVVDGTTLNNARLRMQTNRNETFHISPSSILQKIATTRRRQRQHNPPQSSSASNKKLQPHDGYNNKSKSRH